MTHDRRDSNEKSIIAFWRKCGCDWIPQSREAGFDGLLITPTDKYIVEIKQPGHRDDLTPNELRRKENTEALWEVYWIITNLEEAAELIGLEIQVT